MREAEYARAVSAEAGAGEEGSSVNEILSDPTFWIAWAAFFLIAIAALLPVLVSLWREPEELVVYMEDCR